MEPAFRSGVNRINVKIVNLFTVIIAVIFFIDLSLRPFFGSNFHGK